MDNFGIQKWDLPILLKPELIFLYKIYLLLIKFYLLLDQQLSVLIIRN